MTRNAVKATSSSIRKAGSGQPIHLHVPGDTPIHLHVNQKTQISRIPDSGNVKAPEPICNHQAPWVPPPAKTSSARFVCDPTRRVRIKSGERKSRSLSAESTSEHLHRLTEVDSDKEIQHEYSKEGYSGDTLSIHQEQPYTSDKLRETSKLSTLISGKSKVFEDRLTSDAGSMWTDALLDEWMRDLDTATNCIMKSARHIVECIEQVAYEGRRVDSHDMSRLVQPRDELLLHAEVAGRAGRELCRWASSVQQQQQDQIFTDSRLNETQSREANLIAEVKRLTEKLDRMEIDLETAQKQLNEQQNESLKFNTVHESMESVKGHLQRQLRQRDSECSRLSIQVRNLETRLAEQNAQNQARLQTAETNLEHMRETKEALKRAAKSQKRRADEAEEAFREISHKLATQESIIAGFQAELENCTFRSRSRSSKERQLSDVGIMHDGEVVDKHLREENIRLREVALKCEQRLQAAEEELENLRTNLSSCEALLNDYHGDAATQANRLHTLNERLKKTEADRERSQLQLDDVERRLFEAENRNRLLESALQTEDVKNVLDNNNHNNNGSTSTRLKSFSKLQKSDQKPSSHLNQDDYSCQNGRFHVDADTTVQKDHQTVTGPNTITTTPTTAAAATTTSITTTTNNNNNDNACDLIQELRRELNEARNEKKQIENRTEIRLNDLRAQLNQADATNRSLQAYLTFLKRSYASVFQSDDILMNNVKNSALITSTNPIITTHIH